MRRSVKIKSHVITVFTSDKDPGYGISDDHQRNLSFDLILVLGFLLVCKLDDGIYVLNFEKVWY